VAQHNALATRFLRGLAAAPHRPALRIRGTAFSYERVHELALQWAGTLRAAVDGPLPAVAVLAGKTVAGYVGVLAAHYAGVIVVPLKPDWPTTRTAQMLEAAGVGAVIADVAGAAALRETGLRLPVLVPEASGASAGSLPVRRTDALAAPVPVRPDDVAYVLFTSGSTGRPKGVPLLHRGYRHYFDLVDERYDFHPGDAFAQTVELNFDCAIFDMFCAWGAGACVQPVPASAFRDMPAFAAERGLSVWFSTPSTIAQLRRVSGLRPGGLSGLRWSFFAGEALLAADVTDWMAAAPGTVVENLYGPTELTITIASHRFDPATSPGLGVNGGVPIGAVHAGHGVLLLGTDGVPSGHEGELCVTGPQMTPGYLDPVDDRDRFLEYGGRRWYRTGDRVRRVAADVLTYLGRLDSQVQVKGRRVELSEVDEAVRRCPGVREAATVARPVDGSVELVVFYTGLVVPPMTMSRHLLRLLPQGIVPREFRHVDALPLNANRKVDRLALAAGATDP
jgi:amino acid adenylation domain-containing protein